MILVRYKPETREIKILLSGRVVESGVGDRILSNCGIEMIVGKNTQDLITIYRDGNYRDTLPIVLAKRKFSNRYHRIGDLEIFEALDCFEEGTVEYEKYDEMLRTPWEAAA